MSTFKKPAISEGWMRALLFLALFTGVYVFANYLYHQTSLAATINPVYAGAGIFSLTALILVPLFVRLIDRKPILEIGFNWRIRSSQILPRQIKEVDVEMEGSTEPNDGLLGLLLAIALLGLGSLTLYILGNADFDTASFNIADILSGLILMGFISLAEEAVFRGYILNNLLHSLSKWPALIFSSLLFALLHTGNPEAGILAMFNVFLAGILLGLPFVYTRNLWFSIFFHFAWNFIQGPILGFPVSGLKLKSIYETTVHGNAILTGGKFGFEASIIQSILFILAIGIFYRFFDRRAAEGI